MKKLLFSIALCLAIFSSQTQAQTPTDYQQRLYYTCKFWGYVKYFHSATSTCLVNWDNVLLTHLPDIKNCPDNACFNAELLDMLAAAGPMAVPTTPPVIIPADNDTNLDLGWHHDPVFEPAVQNALDTIRARFRPHPNCNVVDNNDGHLAGEGYFYFPDQMASVPNNNYLNEYQRLLVLFRYWNIVNYFDGNIHLADQPWDTTLYQRAIRVANANNSIQWHFEFMKIANLTDDSHSETFSPTIDQALGYFSRG